MNTSQYTNIAFISYKREDEEWAKWLQKKLEHYKLPTEIRKQNPDLEFAKNPRHVFKDTTDLSGGVLAKAIKEGLDSSKFLIVICSPRAAKSEWVCKEVQDFIDSGREEYIIPFIIDGEPYAKNLENECFPEALKALAGERELLGININENGRDMAVLKIVSCLFDLKLDTLWNRFAREHDERVERGFMAAFCVVILALCGTWYLNDKNAQLEEQIRINKVQYAKLIDTNYKLQKANRILIDRDSILTAAIRENSELDRRLEHEIHKNMQYGMDNIRKKHRAVDLYNEIRPFVKDDYEDVVRHRLYLFFNN